MKTDIIKKDSVDYIIDLVCDELWISNNILKSKTRKQVYVFARYMVLKLLKDNTPLSMDEIGQTINLDRCTVLYGLNQMDLIISTNFKDYGNRWNNIEQKFNKNFGLIIDKQGVVKNIWLKRMVKICA
jgi:chromosomal replication initiation ATPase DnaA